MKAIVYTQFGAPNVLRTARISEPKPTARQVLVKVRAVSLNQTDWDYLTGKSLPVRWSAGWFEPRQLVLGTDIAGEVVAVGNKVTRFRRGDQVFGSSIFNGFAEYVAVPQQRLVSKPAALSYQEAAAIPTAALTALRSLRDRGRLMSGQSVLVAGADSSVGMFAVQIAKTVGAEVDAICASYNAKQISAAGADVIEAGTGRLSRTMRRYDLIFNAIANNKLKGLRQALNPGGRYVTAGRSFSAQLFTALLGEQESSLTGAAWLRQPAGKQFSADLEWLAEKCAAGQIRPVIDRVYALAEIASAMHRLVSREATGKIVLAV